MIKLPRRLPLFTCAFPLQCSSWKRWTFFRTEVERRSCILLKLNERRLQPNLWRLPDFSKSVKWAPTLATDLEWFSVLWTGDFRFLCTFESKAQRRISFWNPAQFKQRARENRAKNRKKLLGQKHVFCDGWFNKTSVQSDWYLHNSGSLVLKKKKHTFLAYRLPGLRCFVTRFLQGTMKRRCCRRLLSSSRQKSMTSRSHSRLGPGGGGKKKKKHFFVWWFLGWFFVFEPFF